MPDFPSRRVANSSSLPPAAEPSSRFRTAQHRADRAPQPAGDVPGAFAATLARQGGRTPVTPGEASRLLREAWQQVTGHAPNEKTVGTLWAQWALETGRGRSMRGYNFGGLKATDAGQASAVLTTREGFGDSERTIRSRFRTYSTPEAGALDYVHTLHQRYPEAAAAAERGDVGGFVAGLTQRGYFTADPAVYGRALHSLSAEHARGGCGDFSKLQDPGPLVDALLRTLSQAIARHQG